jgi:hypothetical protein
MKARHLVSVTIAVAASTAAMGLAPTALAENSVQQNAGNAQIVATPGPAAQQASELQQPFYGDIDALIFHH